MATNIEIKRYSGGSWGTLYPKANWNNMDNKPSTFTPSAHTHSQYLTGITKSMVTTALGYTPLKDVPFPTFSQLIAAGYLRSDYENAGYPTDEFCAAICRWAINTYANQGDITLEGSIAPNSSGTCIMHLYSSSGKDSDNNPRYCSAIYNALGGVIDVFGFTDYVWFWKAAAMTNDLNSYLPLSGGTIGWGTGTGTNDSSDSAKLEVDGGIIKIKNFGNTFNIGQRNASFVHFENTNGATFYFGNHVTVAGMVYPYANKTHYLGGVDNQWARIYGETIYENGTSLANKYQAKGNYLTSHQDLSNYVKRRETILESAIDLNSVVSTGFYMIGSTYKHGPDSSNDTYNTGIGSYAQLLVGQSGNDTLFQMLFRYNTTEVYFRNGYNIGVDGYTPVYSDWKKIANSSEIPDISGKLDKSAFSLNGTTLTLTL